MSLVFVASMPLIWLPRGFRLNAATYIEELHTKLLLGSGNISNSRGGAPAGWNTSPYS
ncbi:Hypothetical protein FKW44_022024 [Caligus rogercresseyi]|uniref:Uncharacterized protein n=1 Tax=Caligus rogercresseyi TaxID=217165 RepID=A0A7T8GSS4_CALRO|nr:Hypothetical protein FKW44_022024 [Caligus rogercresseyi]